MKNNNAMAWIVGIGAVSTIVMIMAGNGSSLAVLGMLGLFFAGIGLYFYPAITASAREHPNQTSIMVLNLLLGWTLVGWVVAMVWSVSAISAAQTRTPIENPPPWDAPKPQQPEAMASVKTPDEKACPFCAEMVKAAAVKCKHCGSEIPAQNTA